MQSLIPDPVIALSYLTKAGVATDFEDIYLRETWSKPIDPYFFKI